MSERRSRWLLFSALLLVAGCSRSGNDTASSQQPHPELSLAGEGVVTASIPASDPVAGAIDESLPEKGTPEWLIHEIRSLSTLRPGADDDEDNNADPETKRARRAQAAAERRIRNEKIVELATEAITKSHNVPEKEDVFNEAVRLLMEARLQLAVEGDKQRVDELYADAAALYKRAPESKSAAEAAFTLARFAHLNAQRHGKQEPRWLEVFARQARQFAENFPKEEARAVAILYAAGWSCELHRLNAEAIGCYTLLAEQYPDSPQAQQVVAVMRRLKLAGQPPELAGPTLEGKYVNIDDYRGKVVLVVFWATATPPFLNVLPQITAAEQNLPKDRFAVIGVNLDEDQDAVSAFVQEHKLGWPQIFYPDPKDRRWNHPIARYYGVRDIPMLWLVGADGKVVDAFVDPANLEARIRELVQ